jgi:hypothetical protein
MILDIASATKDLECLSLYIRYDKCFGREKLIRSSQVLIPCVIKVACHILGVQKLRVGYRL